MLLVVDVFNALFRGKFSTKQKLTTPQGFDIQPIYGALRIIMGLLSKYPNAQHLYLCSDPVDKTDNRIWRKTEYPDYKAQRGARSGQQLAMREAVYANAPYMRALAQLLNCTWLEDPEFEADDLIAWVAAVAPEFEKVIVSGDRDLIQLLQYPHTEIALPVRADYLRLTEENFIHTSGPLQAKDGPSKATRQRQRIELTVEQWLPFRCITGDVSDNIPGLRGIGTARATEIIQSGWAKATSQHPSDVVRAWEDHVMEQQRPIKKWENSIILGDEEEIHGVLKRNYRLMRLTPDNVTSRTGFVGAWNVPELTRWFRAVNFKSLLPGGTNYNQFMTTFGRLQPCRRA